MSIPPDRPSARPTGPPPKEDEAGAQAPPPSPSIPTNSPVPESMNSRATKPPTRRQTLQMQTAWLKTDGGEGAPGGPVLSAESEEALRAARMRPPPRLESVTPTLRPPNPLPPTTPPPPVDELPDLSSNEDDEPSVPTRVAAAPSQPDLEGPPREEEWLAACGRTPTADVETVSVVSQPDSAPEIEATEAELDESELDAATVEVAAAVLEQLAQAAVPDAAETAAAAPEEPAPSSLVSREAEQVLAEKLREEALATRLREQNARDRELRARRKAERERERLEEEARLARREQDKKDAEARAAADATGPRRQFPLLDLSDIDDEIDLAIDAALGETPLAPDGKEEKK